MYSASTHLCYAKEVFRGYSSSRVTREIIYISLRPPPHEILPMEIHCDIRYRHNKGVRGDNTSPSRLPPTRSPARNARLTSQTPEALQSPLQGLYSMPSPCGTLHDTPVHGDMISCSFNIVFTKPKASIGASLPQRERRTMTAITRAANESIPHTYIHTRSTMSRRQRSPWKTS